MSELLAKTRDFTAIFCFNNIAAIGAMRALHEAALRIPQDVSVIGFDDLEGARYCIPSLTTVWQPLAKMGRLATDRLLKRIENPLREYPSQVVLEPELVIRESTCAPPWRTSTRTSTRKPAAKKSAAKTKKKSTALISRNGALGAC